MLKREILITKQKFISFIVIHEIYKLALEKEGKKAAEPRTKLLEKDFKILIND